MLAWLTRIFIALVTHDATLPFLAGVLLLSARACYTWVRDKLKRPRRITFESINRNDVKIQELLLELRHAVGASRVGFVQFHNGERFLSGNGVQKLTVSHESNADGVQDTRDIRRSMLCSLLAPVLQVMLEDRDHLQTVAAMPESFAKNFLISLGVHTYTDKPVRVSHLCVTGYIFIHWPVTPTLPQAEIMALLRVAVERLEFWTMSETMKTPKEKGKRDA